MPQAAWAGAAAGAPKSPTTWKQWLRPAGQPPPPLTALPAPLACCRGEEERRERLTTNDALSYLREVKTRFANNRKVYDR